MQILNTTGMNTPVEYLYTNQYYGGAGNKYLAPQVFNQYQNYNQMQQIPITDSTVIPEGLSQSPGMLKQFEYQNDQAYRQHINQSYFPQYGAFNNFGNKYNPYAYYEEGYYNPYLSNTLYTNMNNDYNNSNDGKLPYSMCGDISTNQFLSVAEQQKAAYEQYINQRKTHDMLYRLCYNLEGKYDETSYQKMIEESEMRYRKQLEYQNDVNKCNYINYLASRFNTNVTYESPARRAYIDNWNRIFEQHQEKYPEQYTLYEFFNDGIAENMYMDAKIDEAKRRDRELNRLYDRNAFKNHMGMLHPNTYDPNTDTSAYGMRESRLPLTIDDMEITLPNYIKDNKDFQRREKFIDTIISGMK